MRVLTVVGRGVGQQGQRILEGRDQALRGDVGKQIVCRVKRVDILRIDAAYGYLQAIWPNTGIDSCPMGGFKGWGFSDSM